MKTIHGLEVREQTWSNITNRQRITVITKGLPCASFFNRMEESGWRMEVPPIEVQQYRDCRSFYVTFINIEDKAPLQPM
jgi:hypothetical protein